MTSSRAQRAIPAAARTTVDQVPAMMLITAPAARRTMASQIVAAQRGWSEFAGTGK
jgi:hypothetical protein